MCNNGTKERNTWRIEIHNSGLYELFIIILIMLIITTIITIIIIYIYICGKMEMESDAG